MGKRERSREILGLARSEPATPEAVRAAFRHTAKQTHPDHNMSAGSSDNFANAKAARDILLCERCDKRGDALQTKTTEDVHQSPAPEVEASVMSIEMALHIVRTAEQQVEERAVEHESYLRELDQKVGEAMKALQREGAERERRALRVRGKVRRSLGWVVQACVDEEAADAVVTAPS